MKYALRINGTTLLKPLYVVRYTRQGWATMRLTEDILSATLWKTADSARWHRDGLDLGTNGTVVKVEGAVIEALPEPKPTKKRWWISDKWAARRAARLQSIIDHGYVG